MIEIRDKCEPSSKCISKFVSRVSDPAEIMIWRNRFSSSARWGIELQECTMIFVCSLLLAALCREDENESSQILRRGPEVLLPFPSRNAPNKLSHMDDSSQHGPESILNLSSSMYFVYSSGETADRLSRIFNASPLWAPSTSKTLLSGLLSTKSYYNMRYEDVL